MVVTFTQHLLVAKVASEQGSGGACPSARAPRARPRHDCAVTREPSEDRIATLRRRVLASLGRRASLAGFVLVAEFRCGEPLGTIRRPSEANTHRWRTSRNTDSCAGSLSGLGWGLPFCIYISIFNGTLHLGPAQKREELRRTRVRLRVSNLHGAHDGRSASFLPE